MPGWPGHDAGQHVDVRLTAQDGYTAVRSYSLASPADGDQVDITVEELDGGEVSPYLVREARPGDFLEIRGPLGGWFVWRTRQSEPVQLIAGGSGLVPLMAMARTRADAACTTEMRLLYSVRSPDAVLYESDLARLAADSALDLTTVYSRNAPPGWPYPTGRIDAALVSRVAVPPDAGPTCYICGPTGFVEMVAGLLVDVGHDPARIRTERFGGTGGSR